MLTLIMIYKSQLTGIFLFHHDYTIPQFLLFGEDRVYRQFYH